MIFTKFFKQQASLTTQELQKLLQTDNVTLLDVRTRQEFQSAHIREARNFPLSDITTYKGTKDKLIYVICQSGMRSKRACKTLNQLGYSTVNIKGGMSAWTGPKLNSK
ncbi:rhodanese-like domain-containing protein [Streptococcus hongkongensis]|nr:sulfurtransferase [Streptococcus uberis]